MRFRNVWALLIAIPSIAAAPDPTVTVRHFTKTPDVQWSFTLRTPREGASATLWWVVGGQASGAIESRTANLELWECPAISTLAEEAVKLQVTEDPIYVTDFDPGHPLARWATRAWDQLAVCADAHPAKLEP